MIKFADENGNIYEGQYPYIHWLPGEQSVGLWYDFKLMVITDNTTNPLVCEGLSENGVFKFVDKNYLTQETVEINDDLLKTSIIDDSNNVIEIDVIQYRVYQIHILCKSIDPGQITEEFKMSVGNDSIDVMIGADFYEANEILSINLSNKGLDLPVYIEKAFYNNNFHEANINNIYINQKFKELISNYIDIIDCKGSYKSLFNSLEWFDWGDNIKMYEVWKNNNDKFFEKDIELILSDEFKHLLYTQSKTTYISLVTALYKITDFTDEEKNPVADKITRKWSDEELAIKISILSAFFERYFLPIHMDLKRACVEAIVFTNSIKVKNSSDNFLDHYFYDKNVVNIDMPSVVVIGNLNGVAVDDNTLFGRKFVSTGTPQYYYEPVGVSELEDITWEVPEDEDSQDYTQADPNELIKLYGQLIGNVGVVVPITVSINLPNDDGINVETINLYRDNQNPIQVIDRKLFKPEDGKVEFTFKLVSTKIEKVSFSLMINSLSGHTWTAAGGYEVIDISGCSLNICKVTPIDYAGAKTGFMETIEGKGNPWGSQYNVIDRDDYEGDWIDPSKYHGQIITQYLPMIGAHREQYNEVFLIQNKDLGSGYLSSWSDNVPQGYWVFRRSAQWDEDNTEDSNYPGGYKYVYLINKTPGKTATSQIENNIKNIILNKGEIIRHEFVYIPQLHEYKNLDDIADEEIENDTYKQSSYEISSNDLICIIPQFKLTTPIDDDSINWEFKNMTTLETINYDIPISTPVVASKKYKFLDKGYWTVTMRFKIGGHEHEIVKNSAFKIV